MAMRALGSPPIITTDYDQFLRNYVPHRGARVYAKAAAAEKRAEARAKGYEGEACGDCGSFTLVRNGTSLKCDTCGSTTGSS